MNQESITVFKGDESRLSSVVPIAHRMTREYHAQEVEKVFRKGWLVVASALDIPKRGNYLVTDVPPLKASLLVVRGEDDKVRVFHNICRHRGDKLVHEGGSVVPSPVDFTPGRFPTPGNWWV